MTNNEPPGHNQCFIAGVCWRTFKTATTVTNSSKISRDRQKCNSTFFQDTAMTQKCNSTFFQATAMTATNSSKISRDRQNVIVPFSKLPQRPKNVTVHFSKLPQRQPQIPEKSVETAKM